MEKTTQDKKDKKKGFFGRMFEKLDKKMEDKAKKSPCCGGGDKGSSCC